MTTHLSRVTALGCVVCRNEGFGPSPAEIHHPRDGQGMAQRADDEDGIPLCPPHHRTGGYGVAFHAGPLKWQRRYGTERELVEQVKRELEVEL